MKPINANFSIGAAVFWKDPDHGICSKFSTIRSIDPEDETAILDDGTEVHLTQLQPSKAVTPAGKPMPRDQQLRTVWRKTHRNFKGTDNRVKTIMVNRNGTCLIPLNRLTDAEIQDRI